MPDPLDPADAALIRRKAARLARAAGRPADADDLAQDLVVDVLRRLRMFDHTRGVPRGAFVRLVLRHAVADLARRRRPPPAPTDLPDRVVEDPAAGLSDLVDDVAAVVAALPPDLRALATLLRTHRLTAAARLLGVPRSTLQGWVGRLRAAFGRAGYGAD